MFISFDVNETECSKNIVMTATILIMVIVDDEGIKRPA